MGGIRSILLALPVALVATNGSAPAQSPANSEPGLKHSDPPPIAFFIARGEPDICGPGCHEWIAADGTIDSGAAKRMRTLLDRIGKRRLPVYFHSPGGSVAAAIEIGRMLRARGMTAGVARTIPQGCDPRHDREPACDALKRAGRELVSELRTVHTLCNSSCVYALIGARIREVTAGARIGVHALALARTDKDGQLKPRTRQELSRADLAALEAGNAKLARYIAEMGIGRGLFEAAAAIEHERLRYISRDEIARFGIDARAFHESRWVVDEGSRFVVAKFATEARGSSKQYRTAKFELSCGRSGNLNLVFSRELAATDRAVSIAVTARKADFILPARRGKPILGYNDVEMEDRFARVPIAFFEDAAAGDTIEMMEAPDLAAPDKARRMQLSTAGLKSAIAALSRQCR